MEDGKYVNGSIWYYAPNKGAPVFFAVAFAASGICHVYQCLRYKSWKLTGLYIFCATLFAAGFALREWGAFDYRNLEVFIASICLVYAAPPLFELCNYYILGRILYYVPYHSPIHPGRVLTIFTGLSIVVEALNGNGAANTANTSLPESTQQLGRALLKAALCLQLVVVSVFAGLAIFFHVRCWKAGIRSARLNNVLGTLYASTALLLVRTIYRTVEYFSLAQLHFDGVDSGTPSPLSVLLNARHPRRYLPETNRVYLKRDGVTEMETLAPERKPRAWWVKLADPFDLWGLVTGKDKETRFWEYDERVGAARQGPVGEDGSVSPWTSKRSTSGGHAARVPEVIPTRINGE